MYYSARRAALHNNDAFHLAAFTGKKRDPIGINNHARKTAKFRKRYKNSNETYYELHAEVDLILKIDKIPERIFVTRFFKDGSVTMAKPCIHCQNFLRIKGVKIVRYTNWAGDWEELRL